MRPDRRTFEQFMHDVEGDYDELEMNQSVFFSSFLGAPRALLCTEKETKLTCSSYIQCQLSVPRLCGS